MRFDASGPQRDGPVDLDIPWVSSRRLRAPFLEQGLLVRQTLMATPAAAYAELEEPTLQSELDMFRPARPAYSGGGCIVLDLHERFETTGVAVDM